MKRCKDGDAPVPYGPRRRQLFEEPSVTRARPQMRTDDMFSGTVHQIPVVDAAPMTQVAAIDGIPPRCVAAPVLFDEYQG